jgi:hypothetical protein
MDAWGLQNAPSISPNIPSPPSNIPGGPYTPSGTGQNPGTYYGSPQTNGPRSILRYVPPENQGGPPGSSGYWKLQSPGQKGWCRFNLEGNAITPGQAHPNPMPTEVEPEVVPEEVPWFEFPFYILRNPLFILPTQLPSSDPYITS